MARTILSDERGEWVMFPRRRKRDAFGAAELIAGKLGLPTHVVARRHPDTMLPVWAIVIEPEGRELRVEESVEALALCRMLLAQQG